MLFPRSGRKRAEVAGLIDSLERQLAQHRADLIHVDGVLRLFQPDRDPAAIKPKRPMRRNRYFGRGELARLCLETFRDALGIAADTAISSPT